MVLAGLLSLTVGLAFLKHPIAGWTDGIAHGSDAPPVLGVGLLVVPAVLVGIGVRRVWLALVIDVEIVRRIRRGRRTTD